MSDNYPDDIRRYDNDPRSPFYVEPSAYCEECAEKFDVCEMQENPHGEGFFCSDKCYLDYCKD
jgi:hypothetical protein